MQKQQNTGGKKMEYYYLHEDEVEGSNFKTEDKNCYLDEDGKYEKFKELLGKLEPKDVLHIYSLEDLGKDFKTILPRWRQITEEKKAEIVTRSKPFIDTREMKFSRLEYFIYLMNETDKLIDNMSYRERIRKKQIRAAKEAKESGKRIGKPKKYTMDEFVIEYNKLARKGLTDREISERLGIHPSTCTRYKRMAEEMQIEEK